MNRLIFISLLIIYLFFNQKLFAQPASGDVYREYAWVPEKMAVFSSKGLDINIPDNIDLNQAVRAEVAIEIANEHLGFDNITFRINGKKPYQVLYPGHDQKAPSPSLWFHHWYPVVPVLLSDIKSEKGNEIKLVIDTLCFDGKQHPNGKVSPEHPNGE